MARYTGPKLRLSRRAGMPLGLKFRDESTKGDLERPPGPMHRPRRLTAYGVHLREVQRVKWTYGVLDRPFRRYYRQAVREPGDTGVNLLRLLERRLDNVVYRLGFALTRAQARQRVVHGHLRVNGRKVTVPSYPVEPGDVIEQAPRNRSRGPILADAARAKDRPVPAWLAVEEPGRRGRVVSLPGAADLTSPFDMRLVVEFMGR
ncbi:MAG TPA: 30S ribosomal protein S4 [Planctomycetota bacterium]|nr:30S ribosomal protein S4 [Planctomycetota bacterium]